MPENYYLYKTVDTVADLPMTGNKLNDEICVLETRYAYVWTGTEWLANELIQKDTDYELASQVSNDSNLPGDTVVEALHNLATYSSTPDDQSTSGVDSSNLPFGEEIPFGTPIYLNSDGKYYHADAVDNTKSPVIGLSLGDVVSINEGIDSYTKLMLHLNNNVIDSELAPTKTITNNNVTFNNSIYKFGYSGVFNGSNSYLTVPNSSDLQFGSGDFCIDSWVYGDGGCIYSIGTGGNDTRFCWHIGKGVNFALSYIVGTGFIFMWTADSYTDNTSWHHVVFCRTNGVMKCFIDGISKTLTFSSGSGSATIPTFTDSAIIGASSLIHSAPFSGYIDEFRISKGIGRWTANFTPPTNEYSQPITIYTGSDVNNGFITNSGWTLTPGQLVYLAVGGGITQTAPTALNNVSQVLGLATGVHTILIDIGAVTRLTKFTEVQAIMNPGDSFTITHDADEDYTRFVQVIMQREDVVDVKFSPDTESNFTFDPTAVEFVGDPWWSWCQMKQVYNVPYMVANYVFENDIIHDYTERSHNGTNHGATFVAGIVNKALSLGGSAYVDIPNSADFRPVAPGTDFFSVEFWVKPTSTDGTIIGVWNEANNRRSWRIYLEDSHIKMDISEDGTTVAGTWDGGEGQWGSHLVPGYWYHIGFSRHANDEIRFSINGNVTLPHVYPGAGSAFNNTVDALRIGAKGGATPAGYFTGAICELAIYKGLDMTATYQTWTGGRFQADYNLNGMGEHIGSFPLTPVTVQTSPAGRLDTTNWLSIFGIEFDWDINKGTGNIYALLSVDEGATWLKWDGSEWQEVSSSTQGTLFSNFPTEKAYWDEMFVAGTLDILIQMVTDDIEATPSLRNVLISTIQNGYQNVDTSKIIYHLISPTETKITNITDLYGQVATRYYNVKGKVSLSLD
jgi:hypothetical protein